MTSIDEFERRKRVISAARTDVQRWSDAPQLINPEWESRAAAAADFIPAGSVVADIGCGSMQLEKCLPFGCRYIPCDIVTRDDRTVVVDLNEGGIPSAQVREADIVVLLGVWEYVYKPGEIFAALALAGRPILCTYCVTDLNQGRDRRGEGWVNDFSLAQFLELAGEHGYRAAFTAQIDRQQYLFKLVMTPAGQSAPRKRVHVISYNNVGNFGDRLGFHVLNEVLPPHAETTWGTIQPLAPVPENLDLLVIGIGNSLFGPLLSPQLVKATGRARATVGIFGTQYRQLWPVASLHRLLDRLTAWHARYEDDLTIYARGRSNAHHLGDWLINAFPMAVPSMNETMKIGKEILKNIPLDRTIQSIQRFRRVHSERLHPLLCALTSAEVVSYKEQRELKGSDAVSGKFHSMLMDIFGRHYPEEAAWKVDRDAVVRYKARVRRNTDDLRQRIGLLLR